MIIQRPYSENCQFSLKIFSDRLNYLLFLQSYLQNYFQRDWLALTAENTVVCQTICTDFVVCNEFKVELEVLYIGTETEYKNLIFTFLYQNTNFVWSLVSLITRTFLSEIIITNNTRESESIL